MVISIGFKSNRPSYFWCIWYPHSISFILWDYGDYEALWHDSFLIRFFVSISTETTFPIFTFISAGIVNVFVPSGGGQWAIQGPIIIEASQQLGLNISKNVMALAYGDQLTNMLQLLGFAPAWNYRFKSKRNSALHLNNYVGWWNYFCERTSYFLIQTIYKMVTGESINYVLTSSCHEACS